MVIFFFVAGMPQARVMVGKTAAASRRKTCRAPGVEVMLVMLVRMPLMVMIKCWR